MGLFAFNIAFLLMQLGYAPLFRAGAAPPVLYEAEATFLGTFLICPIVILIFFPIWQLEDSGIVAYRVFHDERMPADIRGVHAIYNSVILAYAGFSTILTWIIFISDIFSKFPDLGAAILTPIILIILPVIVVGILAGPIFLYEKYFTKTNERLQRRLANLNLVEIQIPKFDEMRS
jgi:hypothetical protein